MTWIAWGIDQIWWQIRAAIYGIYMVLGIIASALVWDGGWVVARYDALLVWAVMGLGALWALGQLRWSDGPALAVVFALGLGLEAFKTARGAWGYPEAAVFWIGTVPVFVGFMYLAVGHYVLRVMRLKELKTTGAPPLWAAGILAVLIYGAYFAPGYWWVRPTLIGASVVLFWRMRVVSPSGSFLPLPVALGLAAGLIWVAENIGTATGTWAYRGQGSFELVAWSKIPAWYLLLNLVFLVVTYGMPDASWRKEEETGL